MLRPLPTFKGRNSHPRLLWTECFLPLHATKTGDSEQATLPRHTDRHETERVDASHLPCGHEPGGMRQAHVRLRPLELGQRLARGVSLAVVGPQDRVQEAHLDRAADDGGKQRGSQGPAETRIRWGSPP